MTEEIRKVTKYDVYDEKRAILAEDGVLLFDGEIKEESPHVVFLELYELKKKRPSKPTWLVLNSPGGYVHPGFAIHDIISMFVAEGMEINILGMGMVASMAASIIQAGSRRFSLPHTQFLIHQLSQTKFYENEEVNEGRERVEELERINEINMKIISERAGIDLDKLKQLSKKKDYWLDAESAKNFGEHGLIDEIITEIPRQ